MPHVVDAVGDLIWEISLYFGRCIHSKPPRAQKFQECCQVLN